jgi:hypothetical protein
MRPVTGIDLESERWRLPHSKWRLWNGSLGFSVAYAARHTLLASFQKRASLGIDTPAKELNDVSPLAQTTLSRFNLSAFSPGYLTWIAIYGRHFEPGQLQFITTSTHHRLKLFSSERFRSILWSSCDIFVKRLACC